MLFNTAIGVAVFLSALALDYCYVRYMKAVSSNAAYSAAWFSVLVWGLGSLGLVASVTQSWWFMLPECLGLFFGTLVAMRRKE